MIVAWWLSASAVDDALACTMPPCAPAPVAYLTATAASDSGGDGCWSHVCRLVNQEELQTQSLHGQPSQQHGLLVHRHSALTAGASAIPAAAGDGDHAMVLNKLIGPVVQPYRVLLGGAAKCHLHVSPSRDRFLGLISIMLLQ